VGNRLPGLQLAYFGIIDMIMPPFGTMFRAH
jgi:hypothetical protein